MKKLDQDPSLAEFLAKLESIPWFGNIGKPLPPGVTVRQLHRWEDWPGPENPGISEVFTRQQSLYDEIMSSANEKRDELTRLWDHVHQTVFRLTSPAVPYEREKDAWHAPTSAVWQATWTAGLIAGCIFLRKVIPPYLEEQWNWFCLGHWPSGYSTVWADGRLGPLLVY